MRMTDRMREEMRRRKAAQAATGLSALVAAGLRRLPTDLQEFQRRAEQRDFSALRNRAAGYAERAAAYAERASSRAARAYDGLAARGRDAMNGRRA